MKNFTRIVRCMLYTVLMMVWGCVAEPELKNTDNAENGIPATRAQSDGKYYYAFDEKVPLYEVADRMVVTFDKENRSNLEERLVHDGQILNDKLHILDGYYSDYSVITLRDSSDKKVFRDDLSKQAGIKSVRQVYAIEDGYEMGYTNEVIMQFKKSASQKEIDEMHKKFNTEVIKTSKLYMLLSIPVEFDPLDVANAYQESGLTNYSYPNFITSAVSYQTLPTDPYFNNQFYLYNTGQGVNGRTSLPEQILMQ